MTNDEMRRNARKAAGEVQGRIEQGPPQEQISDHSEGRSCGSASSKCIPAPCWRA